MTTQLLASELANLIQESKRKHNDLRQAAEKSLEELKQLGNVSENAAPALLSQKPGFVNPFIIACGTKNAKFTGIAIVCLQRLIVARALPRSKLNQVLDALMQASSAGLDVQLKILQALPSLLQNYSDDLNGELLVTTLNICFILQTSKNAIVNNTSAATLQQLVVSVFDKVVAEDTIGHDAPVAGQVSIADDKVDLRLAALDAFRIFNDLCLLTENQRPEFLRFSGLPQTFGLELIESVITNHATVFTTHPEQAQILRHRVVPLVISALKGKPSFATTVRLVRILFTLLRRHMAILPSECGDALAILANLLDQDTAIWKRALCMEVLRGIFAEHALVRRIWALYDAREGERDILRMLTAIFVRLSTEKPAVIGLGPHSTMPAADVSGGPGTMSDPALLETSSVAGIIGGSVVSEASNTGISTQWSSVRVPCIDQLDKTEAPAIPESYIYSLILACISSLSDGLAKFILPLTVPNENRIRKRPSKNEGGRDSPLAKPPSPPEGDSARGSIRERSVSFKKNPVPINPLELEDHPAYPEVKVCADIVSECWPAILATCSTFLYAALDSEYYHGLVRAFQRFAHVAGLLQLATPRDAFLSTLGKAAVPPNILSACINAGQPRSAGASTPTESPGGIFSNARGLLNVEGLTPTSPSAADKQRRWSAESSASLNTRNLLCLRALLNLGIALGPTLGAAWGIILGTLQQADFVLFISGRATPRSGSLRRGSQDHSAEAEANSLMANFSTEVRSVETAASRLIESSVDFPNDAFIKIVEAVCGLLFNPSVGKPVAEGQQHQQQQQQQRPPSSASASSSKSQSRSQSQSQPGQHLRVLSFSSAASSTTSNQEFQFALAKLGEIAMINMDRLLSYEPEESGWEILIDKLIETLDSASMNPPVRTRAAEILSKLMLEAASVTGSTLPSEVRGPIQLRLLGALRDSLAPLRNAPDRGESVANTATDVDIHRIILEGLRSVIEDCGQSLVSGWDIAFDIIGSVFSTRDSSAEGKEKEKEKEKKRTGNLRSWSSKLVRSSFSSLQLICSDFLASLPNGCFLILVDTLHKFCSQNEDLNIALTTITFFWALSDFLSARDESLDFTIDLVQGGSNAALWMLLLQKLTSIASDDRLEMRNSAIQTLLRIFDAYGERLSPEAWAICLRSVVFKLLTSLEEDLRIADGDGDGDGDEVDEGDKGDEGYRSDWHDTAVVVLNCISTLLGNYLEVLTEHESFNELWLELLGHLAALLDFKVLDINTATFKTLTHVLSQSGSSSEGKPIFNETTVGNAWDLWSRGIPIAKAFGGGGGGKTQDNQNCLSVYVLAFREVYRLMQGSLTRDQVQRILTLLRQTVEEETSLSSYSSDVENLTQLQAHILEAVKMIRTDVSGVPSALISQVSEFVTLPFEQDFAAQPRPKRTYVAMSKASMLLLEGLILKHATQEEIYNSGSVLAALSALRRPIGLKYCFPITMTTTTTTTTKTKTKTAQPWGLATSSALAVIEAVLPQLDLLNISKDRDETTQSIWSTIASIADGILSADYESAAPGTDLLGDEDADIASFHRLVRLIIPSIGADSIADQTRTDFAKSLFKTSIIHEPTPADRLILLSGDDPAASLEKLYPPRAGRTVSVPPNRRTRMAYVAFEELFSLVSPAKDSEGDDGSTSRARMRIASTVAPYLILRCALTLRGYIADQPLRGKMPQPLSQRRELLWILRKVVGLKDQGEGDLRGLHPLMVKALGVRGDEAVLGLLREALGDDRFLMGSSARPAMKFELIL